MESTSEFNRAADLRELEPYASFLANCRSIHTQSNYHQDLRVLKQFLDEQSIQSPTIAKPGDLTRFAGLLARPGKTPTGKIRPAYSTRSIKRLLASVRSFYRYLAAIQAVSTDPTAVFHTLPIRPPKRNPRPLGLAARQALIGHLKDDSFEDLRISAMIRLGFECGLRVSEIAGLRVADVDQDGLSVTVVGKGDKQRSVPMTPELRGLLKRLLAANQKQPKVSGSQYVFPSQRDIKKPMNMRYLEEWLKKAANWAGLEGADDLTVHVLRHTFGTCLAESGASVYEIRDLMGHSSIVVSESYVKLASQGARQAHQKAFGSGYKGYALELVQGPHGGLLRRFRQKSRA